MDHIVKMNNVGGVKVPRDHGGLRRSGEGSWAQDGQDLELERSDGIQLALVGRSKRMREETDR